MKLSLNWLSDFVEFTEADPQKIAERLTQGTAEVEHIEVQGALLTHCVVGKVLTLERHPNADKLSLCEVQTEKGKKRVVCGGTNLRAGMLVAFAHVGARVKWHGEELLTLQETKIRGEMSEGMICAAEELELTEHFPEARGHSIIDLGDGEFKVGQPLKEALHLGDVVFRIDNHAITHRADLFSHIGFARECVALGLGAWKKKPEYTLPKFPSNAPPFRFIIEDPRIIPRYASCMLHIEGLGETPDWMRRRLEAVGWRALNLPIDITNYVASEVGMPLHSFDADDIRGDICARVSREGEEIQTLDKVRRKLPGGAIVLSDNDGIFDLLGIMGGLRSSTKAGTKHIYLHSAVVDPILIRRTIIATGHRTEASTVYEKGIPRSAAAEGLMRALELFLAHVPGARIASLLESFGEEGKPLSITLPLRKVTQVLGSDTSPSDITETLTALDFSVQKRREDILEVSVPPHRLGDIREPIDLVEEVGRIRGFATYAPTLPTASMTPPHRDFRMQEVRAVLKELQCIELVQFSFTGQAALVKAGIPQEDLERIANPLGEDVNTMRPSLLPGLLAYASENLEYMEDTLRVFEIGRVFSSQKEELHLALLVAEKRVGELKKEPFLLAKMLVRKLCETLNLQSTFLRNPSPSPEQHPARSVSLHIGKKRVGVLHEVHPLLQERFGFPGRVASVVLSLDLLLQGKGEERLHHDSPVFPSITYDTTVAFGTERAVGGILQKVRTAHPLLQEISLIDLYQKGKGERRLTFRCTYGAPDRTLREEEVKPIHERVEAALSSST